jgi:hypothetical protein
LTTTLTYKAGTDLIESTTASDDPNTTTDNIVTQFEYDSAHRPSKRIDTHRYQNVRREVRLRRQRPLVCDHLSVRTKGAARLRCARPSVTRLQGQDGSELRDEFHLARVRRGAGIHRRQWRDDDVTLDPRRYRVQTMTAATVPTAPTPELSSGHDTGGNVLTLNDHRAGMNQVFQYDSLDRMKNAVNFEYIAGTFR